MKRKTTTPTPSITAAQIKKGELEPLGMKIAAHLKKARAYEAKAHEKAGIELRKADDNWNSVTQLLAEAKAKCDGGGFEAFKAKFCPDLERSRIYELLRIGSGQETLEENRDKNRKRQAQHRAKKSAKSAPTPSVTPPSVTDTSQTAGNEERKEHPATEIDVTPSDSNDATSGVEATPEADNAVATTVTAPDVPNADNEGVPAEKPVSLVAQRKLFLLAAKHLLHHTDATLASSFAKDRQEEAAGLIRDLRSILIDLLALANDLSIPSFLHREAVS
jgi:hypothetical protein